MEIIDVARVIDELYPADRTATRTRAQRHARVRVYVCVYQSTQRGRPVSRIYRGGSSRRERRATASHWPPIGRSGGGSLQSSIQAVIG